MKKFYLFLIVSIMFFGAVSCSKSDDTVIFKQEDIIGHWSHVSSKIYDPNRKYLGEGPAEDKYGCGTAFWIIDKNEMTAGQFTGRDNKGKCIEEKETSKYSFSGNRLSSVDSKGNAEYFDVLQATSSSFVFISKLPEPLYINGLVVQYVEMHFKKVK